MTLRKRLLLTFGAITLLVLAPALFAVSRLTEMRNIAVDQRGRHTRAVESIGELQASLSELDRYTRSYVALASEDTTLRQGMYRSLARAREQLGVVRDFGYGDVTAPTAAMLDTLGDAVRRVESLVVDGESEAATAYFQPTVPDLLRRARESLGPVSRAVDQRSFREITEAQRISESAVSAVTLVAAIAFLVALLIAGLATRSLSRPLKRLRDAMSNVAGGEFVVHEALPYDRDDEIGDLSRSFRTMTEQLAELDRLKAEFVSVASHELKTPINVIGGYAELMQDGLYGEVEKGQKEILGRIIEQTESLTRQVNQLLDISRIEAGGFQVHPGDVELAELLRTVQRTFEPLAEQKRIRFAAEMDDGAPRIIRADGDRLRNELLGNLISNAFKFTPEGGAIEVRACRSDDGVRIDVSDTGSGIPEDQLPFIFDKFYQVGSEARVKGSGLGLAIAKEVTEAHGGRLTAESRLQKGTVFHIELPAVSNSAS